jgi:hypothetical protein
MRDLASFDVLFEDAKIPLYFSSRQLKWLLILMKTFIFKQQTKPPEIMPFGAYIL